MPSARPPPAPPAPAPSRTAPATPTWSPCTPATATPPARPPSSWWPGCSATCSTCLTRQGPFYAVNWLRAKRQYHQAMAERAQKVKDQEHAGTKGHDFHSQVIQAAFIRALDGYQLEPQPFDVVLFRPKLKPTHQLGP